MSKPCHFHGYQRNCYDIFIKNVMILLKLSRVLLFKIHIFNILFALYIFIKKKYKDLLLVSSTSKSRSGSYPDLSMIFHPNLGYG